MHVQQEHFYNGSLACLEIRLRNEGAIINNRHETVILSAFSMCTGFIVTAPVFTVLLGHLRAFVKDR